MKNGTLNFKKDFQLWKACATDAMRPVMEYILLKDGHAYASDSHVLVRVPLEECTTFEEDQLALLDDCLIHKSMLKYIVGFDIVLVEKTEDGAVYLEARTGENTVKVQLGKNGDALKYPNAEEILKGSKDRTPIQKIGLNPKFIASLTAALSTDLLKFEFSSENSAVFVRPVSAFSNAVGVIMPIMTIE